MPIAQLMIEGRYPKYTWGSKPAANSVSAGTRVTITGWTAPDSDWVSDGTYWIPVNGRAVVHSPVLIGAFAASASLSVVASVPGWQMPADIVNTPRVSVEVSALISTANFSAERQRLVYVGVDPVKNALASYSYQSSGINKRVWGKITNTNTGSEYVGFGPNVQHLVDGSAIGCLRSSLINNPIQMYYQSGDVAGTEQMQVSSFCITVGVH